MRNSVIIAIVAILVGVVAFFSFSKTKKRGNPESLEKARQAKAEYAQIEKEVKDEG